MSQSPYTLIGSGNLATLISLELLKKGFKPEGVVSRTLNHAKSLAVRLGVDRYSDRPEVFGNSRFVLIAVSDDAIPDLLKKFEPATIPFFHTSGSTGINVFPNTLPVNGVLYPLQTFTRGRVLDFSSIPFFIEYSDPETGELLKDIASQLSDTVVEVSSEKRLALHIAAVFCSNFLNYMLLSGEKVMKNQDLDFRFLEPLILETLSKAMDLGPSEAQTGPARRGDGEIILNHGKYLENQPELRNLYTFVSESILNFYSTYS